MRKKGGRWRREKEDRVQSEGRWRGQKEDGRERRKMEKRM